MSSPLTRTAPVILILASILVGSPFAIASQQQAGLTQEEQVEANRMYSVQGLTTQYLEEGDKQISGLIFTPRWGDVVFIEPSLVRVLFADCLPGEFAVSSQHILGGSDLNVLESYAFAMPNDFMVWLMVVENVNNNERLPASAGVICVSDRDIDETNPASTVIFQPKVKQQINNIINQIIKIENNQIINLAQIVNVYQQITQTAIQIAIGGGNVTQIINQSASQIVASNGTNVSQIINQTAAQTVASNATLIDQIINQTANQTAQGITPPPAPQFIQPPVITVPDDITVQATGPEGATVSFEVSAQEVVEGETSTVPVSCDHQSGETFPIGGTIVTCTAQGSGGDITEDFFTITVEPPADDGANGNSTNG